MEKGSKIIMAGSMERNNGSKIATLVQNDTVEILTVFPPKVPDPSSFSIPYIVGKVKVETALCDLGEIVSTMPYSLFHKLHLGPLLAAPFSLQSADGSEMRPIGKLDDVPVNIRDIWVLEDCIIVDMPHTDDAQITLGRPILATVGCQFM